MSFARALFKLEPIRENYVFLVNQQIAVAVLGISILTNNCGPEYSYS